ncbi:transcription regulator BDF1 [Emericellopsis atlantica]|uniref:Transcription regulator BDF1 n=1 Tax=Emericellopsis atlantica TaxID=2614577 RepID=A0A9P7ZS08_9HYPO|nr:transcription regulator BDF1 [Emericellopsis atlantica]KAG9256625.1 transcription regulator BDF1 [Emericellopsis atlantica]
MTSASPDAPPAVAGAQPEVASTDAKAELNGSAHNDKLAATPELKKATSPPAVNGHGNEGEEEVNGKRETPDKNEQSGDKDIVIERSEGAADQPKETSAPTNIDSPKDVEMEDTKDNGTNDSAAAEPSKSAEDKSEVKSQDVADSIAKGTDSAAAEARKTDDAPKPDEAPKAAESTAPIEAPASSNDTHAGLTKTESDLQSVSVSQLNIDAHEGESSPVQPSVEVSMSDAPPAAKVAREREEDDTDEPASKRAKTEPKEDEAAPEAPASATPATTTPAPVQTDAAPVAIRPSDGLDLPLATLPHWNDEAWLSKKLESHQLRGVRKSLARVKKTKNGNNFRDSVERLWPGLWSKYLALVEKPMDLSEIDRSLRDGQCTTFAGVRNSLQLLLENSRAFNGPDHYMTVAAKGAIQSVWDDMMMIPEEEPQKSKSAPKANRMRESRSSLTKEEADGITAAQAKTADTPKHVATAVPPRRASSNIDADRPKRTVRPPKPKEIDYGSKQSRRKLKPELQFSDEVLSELMSPKYHTLNQWFMEPVDAEGLGIPHYYSIITHPMDFGKIQRMIHEGEIHNTKEFDKNVRLVFSNCYKFNGPPVAGSVSALAKQLEDIYTAQMKNKDAWMAKQAKAAAPPPSNSAASDEEDEDEDDDAGVEDSGAVASITREIKDLDARLREEMAKQANLFQADDPNQTMIAVQGQVVTMVQQALLEAKRKLNEAKQKGGSGKAKKAKATKGKGAGGAGSRKSGGPATTKKASGANPKKKKNLSAADKDNIANAINDLEGSHLDKAIDIIKRDTGQMESEDGELELDIDQLSTEALLKLWELCKRVLPGFGKDPVHHPPSSPEAARPAVAAASAGSAKGAPKPKKNKPMTASEQERRIADLRKVEALYKEGGDAAELARAQDSLNDHMAVDQDESSDDSSEEE